MLSFDFSEKTCKLIDQSKFQKTCSHKNDFGEAIFVPPNTFCHCKGLVDFRETLRTTNQNGPILVAQSPP